jgi:hypothetical protein
MIEVDHRGYKITFNENADEWYCADVGNYYTSPSLAKVRARIDAMLLAVRKASAVKCFEIGKAHSSTFSQSKTEAQIVEYVKKVENKKYHSNEVVSIDHVVAVVAQRPGSSRASRRDAELKELMPDTPEAHAAHEAFLVFLAEERAATARAREAFAAIPRVTLEQVEELRKIANKADD